MAKGLLRRISALWLIAIFLLCNTPVNVLHYLFANHQDQVTEVSYNQPNPQVSKSGIDCHLRGNVVTEPFLMNTAVEIDAPPTVFYEYHEVVFSFTYQQTCIGISLRAPPAALS